MRRQTSPSMAPRQACELCRRRKVRCDGLQTCSNCHTAKTRCSYSAPKKRGPKPVKWKGDHCPSELLGSSPSNSNTASSVGQKSPALPAATSTSSCPASDSPLSSCATVNPLFDTSDSQIETAARVHQGLLTGLQHAATDETAASLTNRCISLYTQYVFGSLPVCHEARLRDAADCFFSSPSSPADPTEDHARILRCFAPGNEQDRIKTLRSLAILTALCADVMYVVPEYLLPNKDLAAPLFLRASREIFSLYKDYDLEYPDSSSLTIRLFLSSAIQNATGTHGLAFHILGEAGLIAMRMRLYDEKSLCGLDPVEESILRNAFWQLYVCDQTAVVMKVRPVTIQETLFETEFTLEATSRRSVQLFEYRRESNYAELEDRLLEGFHVIRRLWAMASRVIRSMEAISKRVSDASVDVEHEAYHDSTARLSQVYFEMIALTSSFPALVGPPEELSSHHASQDAAHQLFNVLQRQRTSYLINLHSIKFLVLNCAIRSNMTEAIGLSAEPLALAMRQIELAQDFSNALESVPFLHLQAEGEPCAEKIRRVGSLLLELAHSAEIEVVKTQANRSATRLIDMLVRLDSKASDILGQYSVQ